MSTPEKRKKAMGILKKTLQPIDALCNTNNYERISKALDAMTLQQFMSYVEKIRSGETVLYIYVPNMKQHPTQKQIYDLCDDIGLELEQHLIMRDDVTGIPYITPEKYMVMRMAVRRLEQYGDHKLSVPLGDSKIDQLTGQVIGDSRAAAITNPELGALAMKNLPSMMEEVASVRGGNLGKYQAFKQGLEENGRVSLSDLGESKHRTSIMTDVFFTSMGFETNISGESK